jgi:hypothetical protein
MRPVRIAASFSVASTLLVAPAWGQEQGAAAAAQVAPDVATVPPTEAQRALISDRLARSLAARARIVLQREIVFLGVLNNSKKLMQMALALEPENPHIWRLAVALAAVLEDGDPDAAVLLSQGLAKLNRLEPDDEVLRLRRVLDTVNQRQTVEARVDALQAMLTEKAIGTLGADAAARVAFDLALLLRRTGDSAGFERNLILALDLDPNFPEAAELAAGYFRVNAPTVVDEVAAMRAAMLANPMNEAVGWGSRTSASSTAPMPRRATCSRCSRACSASAARARTTTRCSPTTSWRCGARGAPTSASPSPRGGRRSSIACCLPRSSDRACR